jgi:bile acid:Na+ symporter, BASS family
MEEPSGAVLLELALNRSWYGLSIGVVGRYALLAIMFTMGLALRGADFLALTKQPKAVAVGIVGQVLLLPAVAFALVLIFQPAQHIAVGIILLACCPGAATSNFFSYIARGDIALSVVLTALSGLIVLVTLPLLVNAGLVLVTGDSQPIRLPVMQTMREILQLLIIPVGAGMMVRRYASARFVDPLERIATRLSFTGLLLIVSLTFAGIWRQLPGLLLDYGPYALALCAGCMAIGFAVAAMLGLSEAQRRTISIEIGVQNFLLAVVLSTSVLRNTSYVVFPLVYVFVMYLVSFSFVAWCRLIRDRRQ